MVALAALLQQRALQNGSLAHIKKEGRLRAPRRVWLAGGGGSHL